MRLPRQLDTAQIRPFDTGNSGRRRKSEVKLAVIGNVTVVPDARDFERVYVQGLLTDGDEPGLEMIFEITVFEGTFVPVNCCPIYNVPLFSVTVSVDKEYEPEIIVAADKTD